MGSYAPLEQIDDECRRCPGHRRSAHVVVRGAALCRECQRAGRYPFHEFERVPVDPRHEGPPLAFALLEEWTALDLPTLSPKAARQFRALAGGHA